MTLIVYEHPRITIVQRWNLELGMSVVIRFFITRINKLARHNKFMILRLHIMLIVQQQISALEH